MFAKQRLHQLRSPFVKLGEDGGAELPSAGQSDPRAAFNLPKRRFRRHKGEPSVEFVDLSHMFIDQAGDFLPSGPARMTLRKEEVGTARQLCPAVADGRFDRIPVESGDGFAIGIGARRP